MQTSVSSILADVNRNLEDQLRSMLFPIVLMLVIAAYTVARIAAPFTRLYKLTKSVATGQTVSSEEFRPHWNREADQLNQIMRVRRIVGQADPFVTAGSHHGSIDGAVQSPRAGTRLDSWEALGDPYAVIMLDIDHFKSVNDTYGHQTGDRVLKLVAVVMMECVPADAVCSRFGGEEFVVLLRERSQDEAYSPLSGYAPRS